MQINPRRCDTTHLSHRNEKQAKNSVENQTNYVKHSKKQAPKYEYKFEYSYRLTNCDSLHIGGVLSADPESLPHLHKTGRTDFSLSARLVYREFHQVSVLNSCNSPKTAS